VVPSVASLSLAADLDIGIESQVKALRNPQSELPENTLNRRQNRQPKHHQIHNPRFKIKRLGNLHSRHDSAQALRAVGAAPSPGCA
jgi:hypothetical protein